MSDYPGGWVGVDLDGTLAHYDGWDHGKIGAPVKLMVERVKTWLSEGVDVRIVTARVSVPSQADEQRVEIAVWLRTYVGRELPITSCKDYQMVALWDDRAIQVKNNTGEVVGA